MHSLSERDSDVAQEVLNNDDRIDLPEVEIDRQCIDIIACANQPLEICAL